MKLAKFRIKHFRSILKAELNDLSGSANLIGPNNEGKSNVLQALNICLSVLCKSSIVSGESAALARLVPDRKLYEWSRDYPVSFQGLEQKGRSIFEVDFQLSDKDQEGLLRDTGHRFNKSLSVQISFGQEYPATFKLIKKRRANRTLLRSAEKIRKFISDRLEFTYIPAIRADSENSNAVDELVRRSLRSLSQNPDYVALQNKIDELRRPYLNKISSKLKENLEGFTGKPIKGVEINIPQFGQVTRYGSTSAKIVINDGTSTAIEHKGDGVKSLTAISLMLELVANDDSQKNLIVLLEEPESHLHSRAIHRLLVALQAMREKAQVIITTHSALLVSRNRVQDNILVEDSKARSATSFSEIREILGVRPSDNLDDAELVLLVEGYCDQNILQALLPTYSKKLNDALSCGRFKIVAINGVTKARSSIAALQVSLRKYHLFVDSDQPAKLEIDKLLKEGYLAHADYTCCVCPGMRQSEIEDLVDPEIYKEKLTVKYGLSFDLVLDRMSKKWSDRLFDYVERSGKADSEKLIIAGMKEVVASAVKDSPINALLSHRKEVIVTLFDQLERKLSI